MTDPDIQDLKEREQSKNTDDGESGQSATPDPSSGGGGGGGSFPIPRKYVVLGVVIAVALIAWKLKSADGSSSSSSDDELSGDVEAAEDDESGVTLDVPTGAGQDKKDAAVLQYLTETGRMEG